MAYGRISDQRTMFFDKNRNPYYERALEQLVNSDTVVLDLGAGLGIMGFMALKAGAKKVYMVEPAGVIDQVKELVRVNGYESRVECLKGRIEEVDLPEKVDLIVSVFTGNFLLLEDLLPSLFYARDHHLKPGGQMLPDAAFMEVVPVCEPNYYKSYIECWDSRIGDMDLSSLRKQATNTFYTVGQQNFRGEFLADPQKFQQMDFTTANEASCKVELNFDIGITGFCHGLLGWFQARVGDEWFSTSPKEKPMHWSQVYLPLAEPTRVKAGEPLKVTLYRPEFGQWTWGVEGPAGKQRMSEFFSLGMTPDVMQQASDNYKGSLSARGEAASAVLARLNGDTSSKDIADYLLAEHSASFKTSQQALNFVKWLVSL